MLPGGVGRWVPDLPFVDIDGARGEVGAGTSASVVVIRDVGCPLGKRYAPRIAELEKRFKKRGVSFLYVNLSEHDSPESMQEERKKYGFRGRLVWKRYVGPEDCRAVWLKWSEGLAEPATGGPR